MIIHLLFFKEILVIRYNKKYSKNDFFSTDKEIDSILSDDRFYEDDKINIMNHIEMKMIVNI